MIFYTIFLTGYHTQELTLRQEMSELSGECRAHGHLGAVHMALGNYTHAVKCYQEQLERAQELQDCGVEAQAYGNLGIARFSFFKYFPSILKLYVALFQIKYGSLRGRHWIF